MVSSLSEGSGWRDGGEDKGRGGDGWFFKGTARGGELPHSHSPLVRDNYLESDLCCVASEGPLGG